MFKRNIFLVILITSFLVLFFICSMVEATIYVNGASSSSSEDGTYANPYLTIQKGIRNAGSGDTVLVAYAHTYRERIELKSGVRVIGGGHD